MLDLRDYSRSVKIAVTNTYDVVFSAKPMFFVVRLCALSSKKSASV